MKAGWNGSISIMFVTLGSNLYDYPLLFIVFVFAGAITLCFLPPADIHPPMEIEDPSQKLLPQENSISILQGMKNCYILVTTPKFFLLTFTMFANGI